MKTAVLIVAAGAGKRFGAEIPKQYAILGGKPVLAHTLQAFEDMGLVDLIAVVIGEGYEADYEKAASGLLKAQTPVPGGATRQASVRAGLEALASHAPDIVLIHDGARPFPSEQTVTQMIASLREGTPGTFAGLPVSDTLRRIDDDERSEGTVPREGLWRAQTPQGFAFEAILTAHRAATHDEYTDDVALAEASNMQVKAILDESSNFKITTPDDLKMAEAMINQSMPEYRTGYGYDVHRYEEGRMMVLCGVEFPESERGLKGHSDADVALHALTDAILGAIGEGDIGQHFPPSDAIWKGAPSSLFVEDAVRRVEERAGRIVNADVTIICEAPKIGPRRAEMQEKLAELLKISASRINVKATTTEGLGFTGRREGIATEAVVSIALPADS